MLLKTRLPRRHYEVFGFTVYLFHATFCHSNDYINTQTDCHSNTSKCVSVPWMIGRPGNSAGSGVQNPFVGRGGLEFSTLSNFGDPHIFMWRKGSLKFRQHQTYHTGQPRHGPRTNLMVSSSP